MAVEVSSADRGLAVACFALFGLGGSFPTDRILHLAVWPLITAQAAALGGFAHASLEVAVCGFERNPGFM